MIGQVGGIFTLGYEFDEKKNLKVGLNLRTDHHKDYGTINGGVSVPRYSTNKLSDLSTSIFAEYTQRVSQLFRFALNGSYDRDDMLKSVGAKADDSAEALQGWTLQGLLMQI